jgi:hypothetical protein
VFLADGTVYEAMEVILTTEAYYLDENLEGILEPFISYSASVPFSEDDLIVEKREELKGILGKDSSNCINLDNVYYWSITTKSEYLGKTLRIPIPLFPLKKRFPVYATMFTYPFLKQNKIKSLSGIYSVTADLLPIVGKINDKSRVTFLVGCGRIINVQCARGMVPVFSGLREASEQESEFMELISIKRFGGKKGVQND